MRDITIRSLRKNEKKRFFEFARNLPESDFWGKKGRLLRGSFEQFQGFFKYIKPFQPKCFLLALEDNKLVGFAVAVYNFEWMRDLRERYRHDVDNRAYVLGIAVADRRKDVLIALTRELTNYFSKKGIRSVEYPTLGNVCLTTATDVLTPENVDALILFREAGFGLSECYYSMKLDLDAYEHKEKHPEKYGSFRFKERLVEIVEENKVVGRIMWDPIENEKTSIEIYVAPTHRGKGLGTALTTKALLLLKAEGVTTLELGVDGNNVPALKLYRKFGFTVSKTHFYIHVPC